jgi:flagellar basal-body rod modification protein FlgD
MQMPGSVPVFQSAASNPADDSGSSTGQNSSMVTANDFLTLLVTELKNQDPTANTDPNAYVDQLVQVNSLQQLIQINQNTTGASSTQPAGSGS